MKVQRLQFSAPEWIAILLMIAGIACGFYGIISGTQHLSSGLDTYNEYLNSGEGLSGIQDAIKRSSARISKGQNTIRLAGLGHWLFLSGLGVFVVARRQRWNSTFHDDQNANESSHLRDSWLSAPTRASARTLT